MSVRFGQERQFSSQMDGNKNYASDGSKLHSLSDTTGGMRHSTLTRQSSSPPFLVPSRISPLALKL